MAAFGSGRNPGVRLLDLAMAQRKVENNDETKITDLDVMMLWRSSPSAQRWCLPGCHSSKRWMMKCCFRQGSELAEVTEGYWQKSPKPPGKRATALQIIRSPSCLPAERCAYRTLRPSENYACEPTRMAGTFS